MRVPRKNSLHKRPLALSTRGAKHLSTNGLHTQGVTDEKKTIMYPASVRISSLYHAPYHVANAERVISLVDPDMVIPHVPPTTPHLVKRVRDVPWNIGSYAPTIDLVREVLDFAGTKDKILIHCHAGMSRSVSSAIGIMIQRGATIAQAIEAIETYEKDVGYSTAPNMLILEYADSILGMHGLLYEAVDEYFYGAYPLTVFTGKL